LCKGLNHRSTLLVVNECKKWSPRGLHESAFFGEAFLVLFEPFVLLLFPTDKVFLDSRFGKRLHFLYLFDATPSRS